MVRYVSVLIALIACVSGLRAQTADEIFKAEADSLRAVLECPSDVAWPELPAEGRRVFRSVQIDSAGNATAVDPATLARPDVAVPQYAYLYYGLGSRCLPVIIVQAEGTSLGWVAVDPPPPATGGAHEAFFDLLGTKPPAIGSQ